MKHLFTTILFLTVFSVQWVWAQTKVNIGETWSADTYDANTEVTLTASSVSLTGQITIADGKTLTIKNGTNGPVTITNKGTYDSMKRMFYVYENAILNIEGTSGKEIIIDGGADFTWLTGDIKSESDRKDRLRLQFSDGTYPGPKGTTEYGTLDEAIYSQGTLKLQHVIIQNVYGRGNGGAILVTGAGNVENGTTTLENCVIQKCFSTAGSAIQFTAQTGARNEDKTFRNTPENCAVTLINSTVQYCETRGTEGSAAPGGTIRTNGSTIGNLNLSKVTMQYNRSFHYSDEDTKKMQDNDTDNTKTTGVGNGCAVYWNAGSNPNSTCTIDGCTFSNNIAGGSGGALMLECDFSFQNSYGITTIKDNYAPYCGGGMIVTAYNGGADTMTGTIDFPFDIKHVNIMDNFAKNGGGIAFTFMKTTLGNNSTLATSFQDATISGNQAELGGAMYFINNAYNQDLGKNPFASVSISLNNGELSANKAIDGGAIYALNQDITSVVTGDKELSIKNNSATGNGGGIYLSEGEISIGSGTISGNRAGHYGGGLYVHNEASKAVAFTGGTFTGNSAYAGGGACVDGPVTLTVSESNFEGNTAKVGGGICLTGGENSKIATMTYNSGRIRNNTANTTQGTDTGITGGKPTSFTTAYQKGIDDELEGIGGGVFLDSYSKLVFGGNTNTPIGLYGNLAYNGADDIFANGEGTSVHLPNVTGMQLADFKVPVDPEFLYWVKDYITNDTDYSNAPKMDDENAYTGNAGVKRYRYALGSMSEDDLYWKLSPATYTGYVSVALGYEVIYATINKYGLDLDKGENSIFTLTQGTDEKPYMRMVVSKENAVTNSTGETYISKRIALPAGTWTIAETSWSWAYDLTLPDNFDDGKNTKTDNAYTRELTQVTTKGNGNVAVFNFKNTKKTGTTELRMENIKVNKMNASTSGN